MKINRLIFLGTLVSFHFNPLFGKTDSSSIIKPFGIGLHIEQLKLNDIDNLSMGPANKIIFTFSPIHSFRLESELGFRFGKDHDKHTSIYLGLGAFGMFQRKKLNIYSGLRFEYAIMRLKMTVSDFSKTISRLGIGPVLGCEYYIGSNFTLGGEFGLKYYSLETTQKNPPSFYHVGKSNYFTTDTGLFIRFYF